MLPGFEKFACLNAELFDFVGVLDHAFGKQVAGIDKKGPIAERRTLLVHIASDPVDATNLARDAPAWFDVAIDVAGEQHHQIGRRTLVVAARQKDRRSDQGGDGNKGGFHVHGGSLAIVGVA